MEKSMPKKWCFFSGRASLGSIAGIDVVEYVLQVKALLVTHCAISALLLSFFVVAAAVAFIFRGQVQQ